MATTATGLSSPGVGSGLDVNSIVSQLVALERRPIQTLQASANRLQTQLSGMGQLQSLFSTLRDAAAALAKPDAFTGMSVSSGDTSVVTASMGSTGSAAAGTYTVLATSLSSAQTLANGAGQFNASTDTVGSGTLTLRLGSWDDGVTTFTPKAGSVDLPITIASTDTLADVRDKINAANAGVSAALITDTTGVRLTIRSIATGAENGFRLAATDDDSVNGDAAGLSRLAYDPPGGATQMTRTQPAADARATINGIEVRSATDTFAGVVEGLSIKIAKPSATAVTLTVGQNTESVKQLVNKFVAGFNGVAKFLSGQTGYNAETKQAGLFQGDSSVVGLQTQLRSLLGSSSFASPEFQTLSSLGVELQKDGTLSVNGSRLDAALANLPAVAAAFSRDTAGQPALTGAAVRFKTWADGLLDATGTLPGRNKSLQDRIKANQRDQDRMESRVALVEKRLRAQYTALDTTMSKASALSSQVSQQMTALANFYNQKS
jgi:flagellar hook-associated protein 2